MRDTREERKTTKRSRVEAERSSDSYNYITKDNYPLFKHKYDSCIARGHVTFEFEGQLVLREYARYVVEYVEGVTT